LPRARVGQADVYLVDPSGVVGPHALIDVPAALHLSTADELRCGDGSRYSIAGASLILPLPPRFDPCEELRKTHPSSLIDRSAHTGLPATPSQPASVSLLDGGRLERILARDAPAADCR